MEGQHIVGIPMHISTFQREVLEWVLKNFNVDDPTDPLLGVVEEVGELAHAILKQKQGIRGTFEEHEAAAKDAVGDICVYLADLCGRRGWDLEDIMVETLNHIKQRDWKARPTTG